MKNIMIYCVLAFVLMFIVCLKAKAQKKQTRQVMTYVDFHHSGGYLVCDLAPKGYEMPDFSNQLWVKVHNDVRWYRQFLPHYLSMVYADKGEECPYELDENFRIRIDGRVLSEDEKIPVEKTRDYHSILFTREHIDEVFRPIDSPGKEFFSFRYGYGMTSLQDQLYYNTYWDLVLPGCGRYALGVEERLVIMEKGKVIWRNSSPDEPREIKDDYNFPLGYYQYWGKDHYFIYVRYTERYLRRNRTKTRIGNNVLDCECIENTERENEHDDRWLWPTLKAAEDYAHRLMKKDRNIRQILIARPYTVYNKW